MLFKLLSLLLRAILCTVLLVLLGIAVFQQGIDYPAYSTENWPQRNKDVNLKGIKNLSYTSVTTAPGVTLQVLTAGEDHQDNPLIVFLHGFPESALVNWDSQLAHFSSAGYYVIAPDQRGYNHSSKPSQTSDYDASNLAADVKYLITKYAKRRDAIVVGHDWGAFIAWSTAALFPEVVSKLVILNVPHAEAFNKILRSPHALQQARMSWYMYYFQLPTPLPETKLSKNDFAFLSTFFQFKELGEKGFIGEPILNRLKQKWSVPGELTSAISYYRAMIRKQIASGGSLPLPKVHAPTLIMWGTGDKYLHTNLAQLSFDHGIVEEAKKDSKVILFPGVSHWITHEIPDQINENIQKFIGSAPARKEETTPQPTTPTPEPTPVETEAAPVTQQVEEEVKSEPAPTPVQEEAPAQEETKSEEAAPTATETKIEEVIPTPVEETKAVEPEPVAEQAPVEIPEEPVQTEQVSQQEEQEAPVVPVEPAEPEPLAEPATEQTEEAPATAEEPVQPVETEANAEEVTPTPESPAAPETAPVEQVSETSQQESVETAVPDQPAAESESQEATTETENATKAAEQLSETAQEQSQQ